MHRLLILGSLNEFVQLIEKARARGIYTIVCDGYPDTPGKACADRAYDADLSDTEAMADLCRREQVDGILTSFSDYLFSCMVNIAAAAGLPCYFRPEKLPCYRDKVQMKQMLGRLHIATPSYRCLSETFDERELQDLHFPAVAKPIDRYGSRGVCVCESCQEVRSRFEEVCATSDARRILVESYEDGPEYNAMAWVLHGQVYLISIADREKLWTGPGEIPVNSRNVYPSSALAGLSSAVGEILQKIADETGQNEGPMSMQFFRKPGDKIRVSEVTGRFFGYEHELVRYAGGPDLEELLLDGVYDEKALEAVFAQGLPEFTGVSAVLYFHGIAGRTIASQEKARKLKNLPGVELAEFFYQDGEVITEYDKPYVARYDIVGKNRAEIDQITARIVNEIRITDEQGRSVLRGNPS